MDAKDRAEVFDQLAFDFEFTKWSDATLTEIGNSMIKMICKEQEGTVLDSMFDALYRLVDHHDIADSLDFRPIADHLQTIIRRAQNFAQESMEYFAGILACTGELRYLGILEQLQKQFPELEKDIGYDIETLKTNAERRQNRHST